MSTFSTEKQRLRQLLLSRRKALDTLVRAAAEQAINHQLITFCQQQAYRHIGLYVPMKAEVNIEITFAWARAAGCQLYLPLLTAQGLIYVENENQKSLQIASQQGYPFCGEPALLSCKPATVPLEVICIPVVGFNQQGYRLGLGQGQFDRLLSRYALQAKRPYCLGLAFACQETSELPPDPWDQPLDGLITERQQWQWSEHLKRE